MISNLEPDILECEVKWALESINMNKASGGDGIRVELFQILKDDAYIFPFLLGFLLLFFSLLFFSQLEARGGGQEEQPHARGQGGNREEQPHVQGVVSVPRGAIPH